MVAAKTVREWYAFYGGAELGISLEHASVVWGAATKAAEARFTSTNNCYATALEVIDEWNRAKLPRELDTWGAFPYWCKERLNAENGTSHS